VYASEGARVLKPQTPPDTVLFFFRRALPFRYLLSSSFPPFRLAKGGKRQKSKAKKAASKKT
jgi:hypothetical protein